MSEETLQACCDCADGCFMKSEDCEEIHNPDQCETELDLCLEDCGEHCFDVDCDPGDVAYPEIHTTVIAVSNDMLRW